MKVVPFALDVDQLGAEQIDTLALANEHDLNLALVWVVIHVLGQSCVNSIRLDGDVDVEASRKIRDIGLQRVHFLLVLDLHLSYLLEQV